LGGRSLSFYGLESKTRRRWILSNGKESPKKEDEWGLKNIFHLSKELATKSLWKVILGTGTWMGVLYQKYILPFSVLDRIRSPNKSHANDSIFWKDLFQSFPLVGNWISYKVGDGNRIRLGVEPWIGGDNDIRLSMDIQDTLRTLNKTTLIDV
jgi:hypothetical protein